MQYTFDALRSKKYLNNFNLLDDLVNPYNKPLVRR